ncbi:MAG: AgmX/PglI C-terminal domain-containing protein [Bdellovibrionaceae bacterium]|nr:AgmX/PglI C-terminal domain-containing protein [Pseudobdellovibrionaceae bacterium]
MATAKKLGQIVLENRHGQVVRTFHGTDGKFILVRRLDTGRVESFDSLRELEAAGVEYDVLLESTGKDLVSTTVEITDGIRVRWIDAVRVVDPRIELEADDSDDQFTQIVKWTAGANAAFLAFCFLLSLVMPLVEKPQEAPVVNVVIPKDLPQPKEKIRTVAPSERKIVRHTKPVAAKKVVVTKPKLNRNLRPTSFGRTSTPKVATGGANIHQMGALAVLGGRSKAPVTGGSLNLKDVQFKNGSGGGGTGRAGRGGLGGAGRGGFAQAVAGRGLIAGSRGSGGVGLPSGGYGTRGKAGGQNGYGRAALTGGSDGYFQPLEQDAAVEGGLDRDQINEVIQKNLGQILYCYEQGLQQKPSLSGRIGVRFQINAAGRVSTAGVAHTSLRSSQVEGCILSKLKAFKFPEPVGGVHVKVLYPFQFQRNVQL